MGPRCSCAVGFLKCTPLIHSSAFSCGTTYFSSSRVMAYSGLIGGRPFQEKGWGQLLFSSPPAWWHQVRGFIEIHSLNLTFVNNIIPKIAWKTSPCYHLYTRKKRKRSLLISLGRLSSCQVQVDCQCNPGPEKTSLCIYPGVHQGRLVLIAKIWKAR